MITSIQPNDLDLAGVSLGDLVGESSIALLTSLLPKLGEVQRSTLDYTSGGVEERMFWFSTAKGTLVFKAAMNPTPSGEVWFVCLGQPETA